MLPILELGSADIDRGIADMTEQNVGIPDDEFAPGITHRRRSIAATSRLMKQDPSMLPNDFFDELERCRCRGNLVFQSVAGLRQSRRKTSRTTTFRLYCADTLVLSFHHGGPQHARASMIATSARRLMFEMRRGDNNTLEGTNDFEEQGFLDRYIDRRQPGCWRGRR
jgi:hypothetical protein